MVLTVSTSIILVFRITSLLMTFLLSYTLIIRWLESKIRVVFLFMIANLISSTSNIASVIEVLFFFDSSTTLNLFSTVLLSFFGLIIASIYLLFIDYFEHEHMSPGKVALAVAPSSAYPLGILAVVLFSPTSYMEPNFLIFLNIVLLLVPLFMIAIGYSSYRALENCKEFAYDEEHLNQLVNMQLGIVCLFILTPISITITNIITPFLDNLGEFKQVIYYSPQEILLIIGGFLLWQAYARSRRIAFLQPQRVYKLIVVNNAGLPVYSFDFIESSKQIDESLISGGISAVSSMLGEVLGATDIQSISFESHKMMIRTFTKFSVVLFAERESAFLLKAIDDFGSQFEVQFGDKIQDGVQPDHFDGTKNLVLRSFGLAVKEEMKGML
ncbi:MAG: hypothetical protein GF411_04575 [Candidatus Lokiarchaeota archaeon]|nr:hypothetical protein [Candidatus Lokiarchaeota archaeon]